MTVTDDAPLVYRRSGFLTAASEVAYGCKKNSAFGLVFPASTISMPFLRGMEVYLGGTYMNKSCVLHMTTSCSIYLPSADNLHEMAI